MHETIYQAVYRPELGGLHRELPKALRTGRRRRKPHRRSGERRGLLVNKLVANLLKKRWSPEQISHELSVAFPGEPDPGYPWLLN